jgi:DNA-binding NarL/FixJ family response regulator
MDAPVRILIVDDHPIFRAGLVKTLEPEAAFAVVGEASDGEEGWKLIGELHPDVTVLDVSMPILDGFGVARRVRGEALPTELIFLTMYKDAKYFNTALDLGVRGYLIKDSATTEFLACLRAVSRGEYYISPAISHLLVERSRTAAALAASIPALERLTPAERAILRLVADNLTSRQIAAKLFVSERTVENHRMHICKKLGIKGHNKLFQFALENKSAL